MDCIYSKKYEDCSFPLNEPSQEISVNEMENAYFDFVEQIKLINAFKDYSYAFRTLNFVRIELSNTNRGKNVL